MISSLKYKWPPRGFQLGGSISRNRYDYSLFVHTRLAKLKLRIKFPRLPHGKKPKGAQVSVRGVYQIQLWSALSEICEFLPSFATLVLPLVHATRRILTKSPRSDGINLWSWNVVNQGSWSRSILLPGSHLKLIQARRFYLNQTIERGSKEFHFNSLLKYLKLLSRFWCHVIQVTQISTFD